MTRYKYAFFFFCLISLFSFIGSEDINRAEFLELLPKARHILHVQISHKSHQSQWTKGFTDYQVNAGILYDYKQNYPESTIRFYHRADGESVEESKINELELGEEYLILVDDHFMEIPSIDVNKGEISLGKQKTHLLLDSYKGVSKFDIELDSILKKLF